jgi:hypothetical protein
MAPALIPNFLSLPQEAYNAISFTGTACFSLASLSAYFYEKTYFHQALSVFTFIFDHQVQTSLFHPSANHARLLNDAFLIRFALCKAIN